MRNEPVSYAVGFLVIGAMLWLLVFYAGKAASGKLRETDNGFNGFAALGILIFFGASSLLPWKQIGDHTPLFMIQFVWRLNAHSTLMILAAFSHYFSGTLRGVRAGAAALLLLSILSVGLHYSAIVKLHGEENARITEADVIAGSSITFDYGPLRAKQYRNEHGYAMDDLLIGGKPVPAEITVSRDGTVLTAVLDVPESEEEILQADVPVFWYRQQKCTVNGTAAETALSVRGASLIPVRTGQRNEIRISYRHSFITYLSWAVSAVSLVLFIYFHVLRSRKTKTGSSSPQW